MKTIRAKAASAPQAHNPYMSLSIYKNYEGTMKEKNRKRKKDKLGPIPIKSYNEWSGQ